MDNEISRDRMVAFLNHLARRRIEDELQTVRSAMNDVEIAISNNDHQGAARHCRSLLNAATMLLEQTSEWKGLNT